MPVTRALQQPRVSFDLVAALIILLVAATAPAFNVDDAAFFNYLNNVDRPSPLYYYNGYVHLIPEVVAYLLSSLPLVVQAVLYRAAPLVLVLLLYREISRVFTLQRAASEVRLLALAVVLILQVAYVDMSAVLGSTSWVAPLAGLLVVIRVNAGGQRYSTRAMAAVLVSAIAFPPGLLVAGLCAFHAARASGGRRRAQNAIVAVLSMLLHAWFASGFPEHQWNSQITAAPEMFMAGFRDHKLHNLMVLASLATLVAAWLRRRPQNDAVPIGSLLYVGWGYSIAFFASSRFEVYGGFEPQYAAAPIGCALVAVGWSVLAEPADEPRAIGVGVCAGVATMAVMCSLYGSLRGPLELALMKYRFLMMASVERARCRGDEAFVFEDEESSPIVLCHPLVLPAEKFHVLDFVPWVGDAVAGGDPNETPSIINPRPLW